MVGAEELKEYLSGVSKNMNFNLNDIFKILKRRT